MCGIAGFVLAPQPGVDAEKIIRRMTDAVKHRGPDGEGRWLDSMSGVGLGHRRLAIIDLSEGGRQPMVSASKRFVVTYNGEIYNYRDIRTELESFGVVFGSQSDTEVMLASFERWGVSRSLEKLAGMFAFAAWDRDLRVLTLARDRVGKKPLYYGYCNGSFIFASELRSLQRFPGFRNEIDRQSIKMLLRHGFISAPKSIYVGVAKLEPGSVLTLDVASSGPGKTLVNRFWDARQIYLTCARGPWLGSHFELLTHVRALLDEAVRIRMISDVPLGVFLSGGIDSSVVAALMQHQSRLPIRTFTIGFPNDGHDEAPFARAISQYLGTSHEEFYVTQRDVLDVVPLMPSVYDEPFSDSSQIPTFIVSRLARSQVKVALSGDGGDEVFGGYNRHLWARRFWPRMASLPSPLRNGLVNLLRSISSDQWDRCAGTINSVLPRSRRLDLLSLKVRKIAVVLDAENMSELYTRLVRLEDDLGSAVIGTADTVDDSSRFTGSLDSQLHQMMLADLVGYLPNDILVKVDRASMAVALEVRAPFLDHRLIEFMARVPIEMKFLGGRSKSLLRQLLSTLVPTPLVERPKRGFAVPLDGWLRGPLRDWAEALLDESKLRNEGFLNPAPVRKLWLEHLGRQAKWHHQLWPVLMFEAWLEWQQLQRQVSCM